MPKGKNSRDAREEQERQPSGPSLKTRFGRVTFPDIASFMQFRRLSDEGEIPGQISQKLKFHTRQGAVDVSIEQFILLLLMIPPENESYARIVYWRTRRELEVYVNGDRSYFKVTRDRVLDPILRAFLGVHMKNLGVPKEQVVQWFGPDAYKTGVVTKEELQELIDAQGPGKTPDAPVEPDSTQAPVEGAVSESPKAAEE